MTADRRREAWLTAWRAEADRGGYTRAQVRAEIVQLRTERTALLSALQPRDPTCQA